MTRKHDEWANVTSKHKHLKAFPKSFQPSHEVTDPTELQPDKDWAEDEDTTVVFVMLIYKQIVICKALLFLSNDPHSTKLLSKTD